MEEIKFTQKQLEEEARKFLKEVFDMDLEIPIVISDRMKSAFGMFRHYANRKESIDIRISKNLLKFYSKEEILGTLKHECVHYALYEMGKPYRDGDFWFEQVLRLYNIPRTETKKFKGQAYKYECSDCGRIFIKRRKGFEKSHITSCCNAKIKYAGTVLVGVADSAK